MIVGVVLFFAIVAVFFVPRKRIRMFFIVSILVVSGLYLFFKPPIDFDLYRHYELFDEMKKMNFDEVVDNETIPLLTEYLDSAKAYVVYIFIISKIGIKELLPFFTGFIIYFLSSNMILMEAKRNNANRMAVLLSFICMLCCIDFVSISGIRNMLSFALFIFSVYLEMIGNRKKILCWFLYILACMIHMSCVILLFLRVLLLVSKKWLKLLGMLLCIMVYSLSDIAVSFLELFEGNAFFDILRRQIIGYTLGHSEPNIMATGSFLFIEISFFLILLEVKKQRNSDKQIEEYVQFCFYTILLSFGMVGNYDVFLRMEFANTMVMLPIVVIYFSRVSSLRNGVVRSKTKYTNFVSCLFLIMLVFSFLFFTKTHYVQIGEWFGGKNG